MECFLWRTASGPESMSSYWFDECVLNLLSSLYRTSSNYTSQEQTQIVDEDKYVCTDVCHCLLPYLWLYYSGVLRPGASYCAIIYTVYVYCWFSFLQASFIYLLLFAADEWYINAGPENHNEGGLDSPRNGSHTLLVLQTKTKNAHRKNTLPTHDFCTIHVGSSCSKMWPRCLCLRLTCAEILPFCLKTEVFHKENGV